MISPYKLSIEVNYTEFARNIKQRRSHTDTKQTSGRVDIRRTMAYFSLENALKNYNINGNITD